MDSLKFSLSYFVLARSLRSACSFDYLEAAPAKEVEEAGKKTPIFPVGKVAIWIAKQDKFMAALRWFLPRESSCIVDRVIKFKILAIPWFS